MSRIIALIPARAGSKRIPGKNMKLLGGKPLIQWTIDAAQASGIFSRIIVSTDDLMSVSALGVEVRERPANYARDDSPDIEWVRDVLGGGITEDAFAILRPTSPFRTADTIRRAWREFQAREGIDSMRAVEPVRQHPGKMWRMRKYDNLLLPLFDDTELAPWHSSPTQSLPTFYIQNASLEIAWTATVRDYDSISGNLVAPFFTEGWEGFDVNTPEDFERAEAHVASLDALARVSPNLTED